MKSLLVLLVAPLLASHARAASPAPLWPSGADRLEELIAASRSIETYSARYSLSFELNPGVEAKRPPDGTIRIDLGAGRGVRVERTSGDEVQLMWCDETTMAMQIRSPSGERAGRLEVAGFDAEARRLKALLRESFAPSAIKDAAGPREGPYAAVSWSFDERSRRANFNVSAGSTGGALESPLGWLDTLRNKGVDLVADSGRLRFETDRGHFRGALRAADGVLETLVGESPNGRFTLTLTEFSREPAAPELFEVPALSVTGSRDISSELRRSVLFGLHQRLRIRAFLAVGLCSSLDGEVERRAEAWLASFHEFVIQSSLSPWFELLDKQRATVVERLKAYAASGRTREQVEEQRQRELASLAKGLGELEKTFAGVLELPDALNAPAHSEAFNALEKRSFAAVFDRSVRRKVMTEFEAATKLE